jgi:hypothetical protein
MVSPWNSKILVPSFENESKNFVEVVVVQRGDRLALESGAALVALCRRKLSRGCKPHHTSQGAIAAFALVFSDMLYIFTSGKNPGLAWMLVFRN